MRSMIRVLVVEDSPTTRALLVRLFRDDPDIDVAGEAKDGLEAIELARRLRPDVIVMDVMMPGIDGFEATKRIMFDAPTPVVIVSTTVATREIAISLEALRAGALTVLSKPVGPSEPDFEAQAQKFVRKIKAMSQVKVVRRWPDARPSTHEGASEVREIAPRSAERARIVAIAASTGGPAALHRVLSELPASLPVPILVVQHISSGFTEGLARWLDAGSRLGVKVAEEGEPLAPGTVYLAPTDFHLGVSARRSIELSDAPPIDGFRPSATHLFASVARIHGASSFAVVLTGMGSDGVEGLREVRRVGGSILAQDEETSVVFGMPGATIAAGLADATLPISMIATRVVESTRA